MMYLIAMVLALALLGGFVVLVEYESRRNVRLFARARTRLDERMTRLEFIYANVDLAAYLRDEARRSASRTGHVIAENSLYAVRAAERSLTRVVRRFHASQGADAAPHADAREFVKTLSAFKDQLKAVHPEPDLSDAQ